MKAEKFLLMGILFSSLQNRTNLHTFFGHICSQFSVRKSFLAKFMKISVISHQRADPLWCGKRNSLNNLKYYYNSNISRLYFEMLPKI